MKLKLSYNEEVRNMKKSYSAPEISMDEYSQAEPFTLSDGHGGMGIIDGGDPIDAF